MVLKVARHFGNVSHFQERHDGRGKLLLTIEFEHRRSGRRACSSPSSLHSVLPCSGYNYLTDCMWCPLKGKQRLEIYLEKILVYVRAEKSSKFREKISTEFLTGQNSRICTC